MGDEGGFAPNLRSSEEALETIVDAIRAAGYKPGTQVSLALDPAASEFHDGKKYVFKKSDGAVKSSDQMIAMYERWVKAYPIVSIEDGLGREGLGRVEGPDRGPRARRSSSWGTTSS